MLLIKLFRIGPVTGPRLAVLDRGWRPRSNTADRGPVTGPIRNNLINEIILLKLNEPIRRQDFLHHITNLYTAPWRGHMSP